MTFNQIVQNDESELVCSSSGKPLQWHEVWRPADKILPKETSSNTMFLCLVHPKEEGRPYRSARIAHFDGVCFYTNKEPILNVDYWLPFPKYLDETFYQDQKQVVKLNLQFPPEVLLYSIASTFKTLRKENRCLINDIKQSRHKVEELEHELSLLREILQNSNSYE